MCVRACLHTWGAHRWAEQPEDPAVWGQSADLAGQRVEGVKAPAVRMGRMDVVGVLRTEDWMRPQEAGALVSGHSS